MQLVEGGSGYQKVTDGLDLKAGIGSWKKMVGQKGSGEILIQRRQIIIFLRTAGEVVST